MGYNTLTYLLSYVFALEIYCMLPVKGHMLEWVNCPNLSSKEGGLNIACKCRTLRRSFLAEKTYAESRFHNGMIFLFKQRVKMCIGVRNCG